MAHELCARCQVCGASAMELIWKSSLKDLTDRSLASRVCNEDGSLIFSNSAWHGEPKPVSARGQAQAVSEINAFLGSRGGSEVVDIYRGYRVLRTLDLTQLYTLTFDSAQDAEDGVLDPRLQSRHYAVDALHPALELVPRLLENALNGALGASSKSSAASGTPCRASGTSRRAAGGAPSSKRPHLLNDRTTFGEGVLQSMNHSRVALLTVVCLVRLAVAVMLCYVGCIWLARTTSITELMLNAVSLEATSFRTLEPLTDSNTCIHMPSEAV